MSLRPAQWVHRTLNVRPHRVPRLPALRSIRTQPLELLPFRTVLILSSCEFPLGPARWEKGAGFVNDLRVLDLFLTDHMARLDVLDQRA